MSDLAQVTDTATEVAADVATRVAADVAVDLIQQARALNRTKVQFTLVGGVCGTVIGVAGTLVYTKITNRRNVRES